MDTESQLKGNPENPRWGRKYAELRAEREVNRGQNPISRKATRISKWAVPVFCRVAVVLAGLRERGEANALDLRLRTNEFLCRNLPSSFDGFRILHVADTHANLDTRTTDAVLEIIRTLDYDLVVHTGDFHDRMTLDFDKAIAEWARTYEILKAPSYGVFGNHDYMSMAEGIEAVGTQLLFNEHRFIERGEDRIYLAGVDDACDICMDDVSKAAEGIPRNAFSLLLSHDPSNYMEAEAHGFDLMLSGHTHGGQICMPSGASILRNSASPKRIHQNAWEHGDMKGYTSTGAGCSGILVRYNCPPELTLHTLRAISV